ncbi:hypothetical protein STEG23_011913, partial [Scotinomys teguina]
MRNNIQCFPAPNIICKDYSGNETHFTGNEVGFLKPISCRNVLLDRQMEVVTLLTIMEPDLQDSALLMKHLEKHSFIHKCLKRGTSSTVKQVEKALEVAGLATEPNNPTSTPATTVEGENHHFCKLFSNLH